jgi:N-acetylneuraminic acid mutarotase
MVWKGVILRIVIYIVYIGVKIKNMKMDLKKTFYSLGALALTVGVTWLFSLTLVTRDSQQARVSSSQASKYPTSDEALKTLMSDRNRTRSSRDRDFASACIAGAIKCGKIVIEKSANPESNLDFTFYTSVPNYPSFILDDDFTLDNSALPNTQTIFTSPNGSYLVAEMPSLTDPLEYETILSCSDPSGNSVVLTGSVAVVAINMNAGETISCVFRNMMAPEQPTACDPGDVWTPEVDLEGTERQFAISLGINNMGYVGMGNNNGVYYQDFWRYDPVANSWSQQQDYPGGPRAAAAGFSIGTSGYVGTGENAGGSTTQDFWEYNSSLNVWTPRENFPGSFRRSSIGFAIGTKGYMGLGENIGTTPLNGFWEYNPATDAWTVKANFPGGARTWATGFSIGGKGYVGLGRDEGTYYEDFWEYDPTVGMLGQWTQKANFAGGVRVFAPGFSIGTKGYIGTGISYGGTLHQDFWEFDPDLNPPWGLWTPKASFAGDPRGKAVGFSTSTKGYIGTGYTYTTDGILKKDLWEYCP